MEDVEYRLSRSERESLWTSARENPIEYSGPPNDSSCPEMYAVW